MVDAPQLTIVDVSALIAIVGAAILYFGKIIGDLQEERYTKLDYYKSGFEFILFFVLIPSIFIYSLILLFVEKLNKSMQIISFVIVFFIVIAFLYVYLQHTERKIKIIENPTTLYQYQNNSHILDKGWMLWIFDIASIYLVLMTFELLRDDIFYIIIVVTLYFLILTYIAINYGLSMRRFPEVTVYTENDKIITGVLLSRGDFIELLEKDKITRVNADKVIYIEEISRDDTEK